MDYNDSKQVTAPRQEEQYKWYNLILIELGDTKFINEF